MLFHTFPAVYLALFLRGTDLIDVRDEFALSWHVHFLIVCPHLALDCEEENLQVPFLCKSVETRRHFCLASFKFLISSFTGFN